MADDPNMPKITPSCGCALCDLQVDHLVSICGRLALFNEAMEVLAACAGGLEGLLKGLGVKSELLAADIERARAIVDKYGPVSE